MGFGRRDVPEIVAALAAFIAHSEPYLIGFDPPLDLRAVAAELSLLPVTLDMGGCAGLRPSGEPAFFVWDEPDRLEEVGDEITRNAIYHLAGLKYPTLAPLVPHRPSDAVDCPSCGGLGRLDQLGEQLPAGLVCVCGGLGWAPKSGSHRDSMRFAKRAWRGRLVTRLLGLLKSTVP